MQSGPEQPKGEKIRPLSGDLGWLRPQRQVYTYYGRASPHCVPMLRFMIAAHCDFLLLTADSELVVSVFCALLAERSPANFHFQFRSYFSLSGWGLGLGGGLGGPGL